MKYTDFQLIWRFESMIFMAKHFFRERSLHTTVHKLRRRSGTLGDASRKKYFNDFLFHFDQKMRLALRSMTFQTFCIFRTAQNSRISRLYNKHQKPFTRLRTGLVLHSSSQVVGRSNNHYRYVPKVHFTRPRREKL